MDPISAIGAVSAVLGIFDVLFRVGKYLDDIRGHSKTIESDIQAFKEEIEALTSVNKILQNLKSGTRSPPLAEEENVWNTIETNREGCKAVLLKLEDKLKFIVGKGKRSVEDIQHDEKDGEMTLIPPSTPPPSPQSHKTTRTFQGIKQTLRKQSADPELAKIHQNLNQYNQALSTLVGALNLLHVKSNHVAIDNLGEKVEAKIDASQAELLNLLKGLTSKVGSDTDHSLLEAIDVAATVSAKSFNRHFSIPRPVRSYYTGRKAELDELAGTLKDREPDDPFYGTQKRFVVHGLGGSGKTQFCCKFAELNRTKFWGIFHINAHTPETAKESFKAIANIGGVGPNNEAAKDWLASLGPDKPWLLIIDNVDDPDLEVDDYFPKCDTGFVLITTRVYENTHHGTVGRQYLTFVGLESDAAIDLLLNYTREKKPWTEKARGIANIIATAMGHLPLALIHAATAISKGICKLAEYLPYFKDALSLVREKTRNNKRWTQSRTEDAYLSVYSSYEVIYNNLEKKSEEKYRDAIELLKVFSFLSRENIRLDVLVAAAEVPLCEEKADQKEKLAKKKSKTKDSWNLFLRQLMFALRTEVLKDRSLPILPAMLRDFQASRNLIRYKTRLGVALNILDAWSLATRNEELDSYSIHPLVHDWVRIRPQMKLGEQALWSQAATNTLGQSIMLPTRGILSADDMKRQRSLLLHISHLRERKREILNSINELVQARQPPWSLIPVLKPTPDTIIRDRIQARQAAKFSYIYFICDHYKEAQELQKGVRDFLVPNLGLQHDSSIQISRFLAKTCIMSGSGFNAAGDLMDQALTAAKSELGDQHKTTLDIMHELGEIRTLQGRFPEAEQLLQAAIDGRNSVCGPEHQDTLCSIDQLGAVYYCLFRWERARQQHLQALAGMEKHAEMGSDHEKTLSAKERLACAILQLGPSYYDQAHTLLEEVVAKRSKLLGKESPYTLLSIQNLAFNKHKMGNHSEAETMMRAGLVIADRNLGRSNHGVLNARRRLAQILAAQQKYAEAEETFLEVCDVKHYKDSLANTDLIKNDHSDRIFSLYLFVKFWEAQGKIANALKYCEELCKILKKSVHIMADTAREKQASLLAMADMARTGTPQRDGLLPPDGPLPPDIP